MDLAACAEMEFLIKNCISLPGIVILITVKDDSFCREKHCGNDELLWLFTDGAVISGFPFGEVKLFHKSCITVAYGSFLQLLCNISINRIVRTNYRNQFVSCFLETDPAEKKPVTSLMN